MSRTIRHRLSAGTAMIVLVILFAPSSVSLRTFSKNERMMGYVKGIEGKTHAGRASFIKKQLKQFGFKFFTMAIDTVLSRSNGDADTIVGENIIVRLGAGKQKIVIGAHYDAVPGSPGANDNGSGVAVLLELVRTLGKFKFRHTIDFCFFDQEETGLIGSAVYVHRYDAAYHHLAMMNLDVEGTGNEIYAGPVGGGDDDLVMKYVRAARDSTRFLYEENVVYPESDHTSFANAKLENISVSVVPNGDVARLVKWMKPGFQPIKDSEDMPVVMKVMHTSKDRSRFVTSSALNMSYEFIKTLFMLLETGEH